VSCFRKVCILSTTGPTFSTQRYIQRDLISRSAVFPTRVAITAGDHALAIGSAFETLKKSSHCLSFLFFWSHSQTKNRDQKQGITNTKINTEENSQEGLRGTIIPSSCSSGSASRGARTRGHQPPPCADGPCLARSAGAGAPSAASAAGNGRPGSHPSSSGRPPS